MSRRRDRPTLRASLPGLRALLTHLRPHLRGERRLLVAGTVALFAEVAMRLLEPWPLKYVVDAVVAARGADVATPTGTSITVLLLGASAVLLLVTLGRAAASYAMTIAFALAGNRLLSRVRADLFAHLQRLPMAYHDRSRTGDLVTRVVSDVGRLKEVSITAALPLLGNTVTLTSMLVVVAVMDWQLALVLLLVLPLFLRLSVGLSRKIHTVSRKQRHADGALASHATESLSAMRLVKSYSLEGEMQQTFSRSNSRSLKDGVQAKRLSAGLERKTDVLVGLATSVVLFAGAQRVVAGAMSPGELVVFLTYLKAAFKPMRDVAKYTGRIAQAAASAERIVDVLETVPTVTDRRDAREAPPFAGHVCFEDVWLEYDAGHPVLRGITLDVPAGQRVALLGPSGAGKSSLAMLLSRLCDPSHGRVTIDGHDLRDLTTASVRRQMAVVLQESILFATTIRENIAFGAVDAARPGTADVTGEPDVDVAAAARVAGAHDFILRLPDGYDTVVAERGETLSGGQRQRIAIARAAARRAPIVILDEAMTGLDRATEREVHAALDRLTEGCTTFVISHDLDAALTCDRAVWIEDGRVVDDGDPVEVLRRRHGGRRVGD